jgi:hypothetical protein
MYKHFSEDEVRGLNPRLVLMLDWARDRAGVPFIIKSGRREEGIGVEDSAHIKGLAVDLACTLSRERFKILEALFWVGFHRIGVYDLHVHADIDISKPPEVCWWGKSK